jgi:FKBP-type peptidyl-prolyl cis-trans isomerase
MVVPPLTGCGDDSTAPSPSVAEQPARPPTPAQQARADEREQRRKVLAMERTFAPNPWREPGASRPHPQGKVTRVIVREVKRGRGPALKGTESVYANFVKSDWRSGRKLVSAWGPGRFEFVSLTQDPAMARGMTGMRPGGRRVIVIPRTMSDVHDPDSQTRFVDARVDIVLRQIISR